MMPDLGKYADTVLSAYALTFVLLAGLIGVTLWRGWRVRKQLTELEKRARDNG